MSCLTMEKWAEAGSLVSSECPRSAVKHNHLASFPTNPASNQALLSKEIYVFYSLSNGQQRQKVWLWMKYFILVFPELPPLSFFSTFCNFNTLPRTAKVSWPERCPPLGLGLELGLNIGLGSGLEWLMVAGLFGQAPSWLAGTNNKSFKSAGDYFSE